MSRSVIDYPIAPARSGSSTKEKTMHLPGLNSIRAIAALIVVIWHIDQYGNYLHIGISGFYKTGMAASAVDIFFVLSGFLITYLLYLESGETGRIAVKKFYVRRILRIWPLYYTALFIAVLLYIAGIIKTPNFSNGFLLYLFFLPNLAFAMPELMIKGIIPLWSIGVEEQFYLLWPLLMIKWGRKLKPVIYVIGGYLFIKVLAFLLESFHPQYVIYEYIHYTRIDIMAIGAFGAWAYIHKKEAVLKFIFHPVTQLLAIAVIIYSIIIHPLRVAHFIDSEVNALFYLVIIMNVSLNNKTLIKIDNPVFNYIGKISFGIYVYHMLIVMSIPYIFPVDSVSVPAWLMYIMIILLVITVASLSYFYFEKPILSLKNKYTVIKSSN